MPILTTFRDALIAEIQGFWRTRFPQQTGALGGSIGRNSTAQALALFSLIKAVEDADREWPPNKNSSSGALQLAANTFGLPSNLGGYGPNGATLASGGVAPLTGAKGTTFPNNMLAVAADGVTQVSLSGAQTIPAGSGTGSVNGSFVALTPGSSGNLPAGTPLTLISPPVGADTTVTLSSGLSGALDNETPIQLLARLLARLQLPPKGGAEPDYIVWAGVPGVLKVYEYPRRHGTGAVDMVVVAGGSGIGRVPGAGLVAAAQAAVDLARPVAVETALVTAPLTQGVGHVLRVRIKPSTPFDWDDTSTVWLVTNVAVGIGVGGGDRITLSSPPPASLTNAVDLGNKPRVYFALQANAPPVALQTTVVAYNVGANTVDLANPNPPGWIAPVAAVSVMCAGGVAYTPIASALLAYADSLGPSRLSGYGDTVQPWDDTLRFAVLGEIALSILDVDGITHLATDLVATPTIDAASANITGADGTPLTPPELLIIRAIHVNQ